jgi:L(+)-tartrate dehydratase beta subunit
MSKVWHLETTISEEQIRKLQLLDTVYISGKLWGIRDRNLGREIDDGIPLPKGVNYDGYPVLHEACGYIKKGKEWFFTSGMGTTTSTRMERWMPILVERHHCRAIIGKGGLLEGTTAACKKNGCAYLGVVGGAAAYYDARAKIINVYWPDLDSQAILECEIKDYGPLFVGIDAHGNNHYLNLREKISEKRSKLYDMLKIEQRAWAPQFIERPRKKNF